MRHTERNDRGEQAVAENEKTENGTRAGQTRLKLPNAETSFGPLTRQKQADRTELISEPESAQKRKPGAHRGQSGWFRTMPTSAMTGPMELHLPTRPCPHCKRICSTILSKHQSNTHPESSRRPPSTACNRVVLSRPRTPDLSAGGQCETTRRTPGGQGTTFAQPGSGPSVAKQPTFAMVDWDLSVPAKSPFTSANRAIEELFGISFSPAALIDLKRSYCREVDLTVVD